MIELRGSRAEIARAVEAISPTYPVTLIEHLDAGEWNFILNGVDTIVQIEEEEEGKHDEKQRDRKQIHSSQTKRGSAGAI